MKRCLGVLVRIEVMVAAIVAMAVAGLCASAGADAAAEPEAPPVAPRVAFRGDASLSRGSARFRITADFSTDPPHAEPLTLQRIVMLFPDRAGTNGRLFPSCGARLIARFKGSLRRCPRGAQIGSGTVTGKVIGLPVTATARLTIFNSGRGRSVTFNISATRPAYINVTFDAPLRRARGRYGERLTLAVPQTLQEIISGVFVGVRNFDATLDGTIRVRGVRHAYIKARRCPRHPMRGTFSFVDSETGRSSQVMADAVVRCRRR